MYCLSESVSETFSDVATGNLGGNRYWELTLRNGDQVEGPKSLQKEGNLGLQ